MKKFAKKWKWISIFVVLSAILFTLIIFDGGFELEIKAEMDGEMLIGAKKEVESGDVYGAFLDVLRSCGCAEVPHFYIAEHFEFNAGYVYSRYPFRFRPGKVVISRSLMDFLRKENLKAVIAHELGHRDKDWGFPSFSLQKPFESHAAMFIGREIEADAFAARCVGRDSMLRMLTDLRGIHTRESWSDADLKRLTPEQLEFLEEDWGSDNTIFGLATISVRMEALKAAR